MSVSTNLMFDQPTIRMINDAHRRALATQWGRRRSRREFRPEPRPRRSWWLRRRAAAAPMC